MRRTLQEKVTYLQTCYARLRTNRDRKHMGIISGKKRTLSKTNHMEHGTDLRAWSVDQGDAKKKKKVYEKNGDITYAGVVYKMYVWAALRTGDAVTRCTGTRVTYRIAMCIRQGGRRARTTSRSDKNLVCKQDTTTEDIFMMLLVRWRGWERKEFRERIYISRLNEVM